MESLDNKKKLKFQRNMKKSTFWGAKEYTVKTLFEFIVKQINTDHAAEKDSLSLCRKKVFHLLQNFEYEIYSQEELSAKIMSFLKEIVPFNRDLQEKQRNLLFSLLKKASKGGACIDADEFFKEHGLNAVSLRKTQLLAHNSSKLIQEILQIQGYNSDCDVRPFSRNDLLVLESGQDINNITVISGESGTGKSWSLYSLANSLINNNDEIVVLINAKGNCGQDLNAAATIFNEDIWGHDFGPSLNRIARRFEELGIKRNLWVLIDNVQNPTEISDLMFKPWKKWGFRLVVSCQEQVYNGLTIDGKTIEHKTSDFSFEELNNYLNKRANIEWHDVPSDIRDSIKRPILADIYCKISKPLNLDSEYHLYNAFWNKIDISNRFDSVGIQKLAFTLLNDSLYPWTGQQVLDAGINAAHYERLYKIGWIRETKEQRYEIPHSRLLNWAVAESIVNEYLNKRITPDFIANIFEKILFENKLFSGQSLGYIMMDVVWILAARNYDRSLLNAILKGISRKYHNAEIFYSELSPTVGTPIIPYLFDELTRTINDSTIDDLITQQIIKGITQCRPNEIKDYVSRLLSSENKLNHRYATLIISKCPLPVYLDQLWNLHCEAIKTPDLYFRFENDSYHFIYRDTFNALKECVRLKPFWIFEQANKMSAESPVHDLAYLLANIDNGKQLWLECKKYFFKKISIDKERAIATNICKWQDVSEEEWCVDRVSRKEDFLGATALKALTIINPVKAAGLLKKIPKDLLYLDRNSAPKDLLIQRPEIANKEILDILRSSEKPLWTALIYQGNESLMSVEIYDYLLDELNTYLVNTILAKSDASKINIYPVIIMLNNVNNLDLLKCLQRRKGQDLEKHLKKWLKQIGARKSIGPDSLERRPALDILYKIDGKAYIDVINSYLKSDSRYGKYDAIKNSIKRYNKETIKILHTIALSDDLWDDYPMLQSQAAKALCATNDLHSVFKYVEKWGLNTSKDITEYLRGISADELNKQYTLQTSHYHLTEGNIMALGLARRFDMLDSIRAVSKKADLQSNIGKACTIAFGDLCDIEALGFLEKQLSMPKQSFLAKRSLINIAENDHKEALAYLYEHCIEHFDFQLAFYLIYKKYRLNDILEQITKEWAEENWFKQREIMTVYRHNLMKLKPSQLRRIFQNHKVKKFVQESAFSEEGNFWYVGSKYAAIELYSMIDKNEAFKAAKKAFHNPSSHDRTMYPYLLLKLNRKQAETILFDQLKVEEDASVRCAICRALSDYSLVATMKTKVKLKDRHDRKAAYLILGWQRTPGIEPVFMDGYYDSYEDVSDVAKHELLRYTQYLNVEAISKAFNNESDNNQKWIYLDMLLDTADPGDDIKFYPYWADAIWKNADTSMQKYLWEQLKDRHKKLQDKLKKNTS